MARSDTELVVLGATGYVGRVLCEQLVARGVAVTVVCPPSRSFLLPNSGIKILPPSELGSVPPFKRVLNLAYPTQGIEFSFPRQNREIAQQVIALAAPGAVVVHTSTLAVFGFDLDLPVQLALPIPHRDFQYIESKVEMEHLLADGLTQDVTLHIVRLGNVWGPASPHWTVALIDRLIEGDPAGVRDQDGYSNATDVANVASYLQFLVDAPAKPGVRFHHLAEFSAARWGQFIGFLEGKLGRRKVIVPSRPVPPAGLEAELKGTLRGIPVGGPIRSIFQTRELASIVRRGICASPGFVLKRLEAGFKRRSMAEQMPTMTPATSMTLRLLSCPVQFQSALDPGWSPPVDRDESFRRVEKWMAEVGFVQE